jgi:transcriptional regulator GlxA family with amidase domain
MMPPVYLNQEELARRWKVSPRTLERWRWRWLGRGPQHVKVCGRVIYRIADVEGFEQASTRTSTSTQLQER